jgi:hypothetical protein
MRSLAALLAVLGVVALGPASAAGGTASKAASQPGSYAGAVFDDGEKPNDKEWVSFRVTGNGKFVKGFTTRLWVICYVGPPIYNQLLPVKFSAPKARISGKGRVDHTWTEPYELNGHLTLRFRRSGRVTGAISAEFGACGTTTGDPPGDMIIQAKRKG